MRTALRNWRAWLWPALTLISFYLLLRFAFGISGSSFLSHQYIQLEPGTVPEVRYDITVRGALAVCLAVLFSATLILSLRQWARYYLNRKLILSYLIFAMIPLVCTVAIFVLGIRALFGITSANTIENTLIMLSDDLAKYSASVQEQTLELISIGDPAFNVEFELADIIDRTRETELSRHRYSDLMVDVYFLSTYNASNTIACGYCDTLRSGDGIPLTGFKTLKAEVFQSIFPNWFQAKDHLAIVSRKERLFIQQYSVHDFDETSRMVVVSSVPIDTLFIEHIRDTMDINISLDHVGGYWSYRTESELDSWFIRWLFRPLSSTWEFRALDWSTGIYEHTANVTFEISPNSLLASMGRIKDRNFLGNDQKQIQFYLILGITLFLVLAELLALVFGIYLISYITRSLNAIAYGHEHVATGDLNYRLPNLGKDQIGAMGRSFNAMANNINRLLSEVREKEKYEEELRIARDIQMSLLPDLDDHESEHISAICIPARQVGGDYYDVFEVGAGRVGIFIADVSGKGTSAAFYMAELKGVLIALRHLWDDPRQLMLSVNEILFPALSSNIFISAAYLLLDAQRGQGTLVRAGHCPALHLHKGQCNDVLPPGMAIGLARNTVFSKIIKPEVFTMHPDDRVILYTDGLDEMTNQGELYGLDRLKTVLMESSSQSSEEIRDAVLADVRGFVANGEQDDDLTLVVASLPTAVTVIDELPKTG